MALWVSLFVLTALASPWMSPDDTPQQRAQQLLAQMTQSEKISMIGGAAGPYVGNVPAIPRLGVPALNLNDGPQGFRDDAHPGTTTQWPSGLTIAQSWDPTALFQFGSAMGEEFFLKGANVQLGPGVNVARVPVCGRNFEYVSGEDPFLGASNVAQVVKGIQSQGVIANVKHYINNNQEKDRMTVSAEVDERTRVELYQPPFWSAVSAGVLSAMCSYNRINSVYACQNNQTLNTELKSAGYGNFSGWVMSDWTATHSTIESANAGLDQEMPRALYFSEHNINNAIAAGNITQATLDDKVYRILVGMFTAGLFDRPVSGSISANVTSLAHNSLARNLSANSIVLLKNKNNLLPLSKSLLKVGVFGTPASNSVITGGGGSGSVVPPYVISPLQGITAALSSQASVSYCAAQSCAATAANMDVAICVMATSSSEGIDRSTLALPSDETALCQAVGQANSKTVAVVINPGAVLTAPWDDNVAAILAMGMPGQEEGNALADVLFGDVNPSARLPVTFPNVDNEVEFTQSQYPGIGLQANYSEKLLIGYRWYTANKVTPRFPFGHGLSYTTFDYSAISITGRTVSVTITNTGGVAGAEVVQLYIQYPESSGEPPLQLRGFSKVTLSVGSNTVVTFTLSDQALSIWDPIAHRWSLQSGTFTVFVGASSSDLRLQRTLVV